MPRRLLVEFALLLSVVTGTSIVLWSTLDSSAASSSGTLAMHKLDPMVHAAEAGHRDSGYGHAPYLLSAGTHHAHSTTSVGHIAPAEPPDATGSSDEITWQPRCEQAAHTLAVATGIPRRRAPPAPALN